MCCYGAEPHKAEWVVTDSHHALILRDEANTTRQAIVAR